PHPAQGYALRHPPLRGGIRPARHLIVVRKSEQYARLHPSPLGEGGCSRKRATGWGSYRQQHRTRSVPAQVTFLCGGVRPPHPAQGGALRHPPLRGGIRPASAVALEELHRALVLLGRLTARERAEIAPLAGARILLARIEPVLTGFELADHDARIH